MQLAKNHQRPLIASIDVTNWCNLHCPGCYWTETLRHQELKELPVDQGTELLRILWREGVRQFMFLGGEPMSQREKVAQWVKVIASLGGISTVVTNGTYGLPAPGEWPRAHYFISCDGDKTGMDKVRGFDPTHGVNVFEKVRKVASGRPDVMLNMTISKLNYQRVEPFVRETATWQIGGVAFQFITPYIGKNTIALPSDLREQVVQKLLKLKVEFGDFVAMSRRAIELLSPTEVTIWSPNCPNFIEKSFAADGTQIERCIFGPRGDCSHCGCNIATSAVALQEGDRETVRMVMYPARRAGIR